MKERKTKNFYLLAHFQYERDMGLVERYRNNGELEKTREVLDSFNRFIKWWNKAVNQTALNKALRKGKPTDYKVKLELIHDKYNGLRRFEEIK